jgi:DNA processing protein
MSEHACALHLPSTAYATALAGLPGMGPARLTAILSVASPRAAWQHVVEGRRWTDPEVVRSLGTEAGAVVDGWCAAARGTDPAEVWRRVADTDVVATAYRAPGYPPALAGDIEPPAVIFHRGSLDAIAGARVAVVGTRRCSSTGSGVAFELGRDLAAAGVAVVSGLASGIDAAAHRGALAAEGAPPIGVAGTGLDVVYPRGQDELWHQVAGAGVLLTEAPPGAKPERWRFPARNRIIAALADVVVVVESHRRGGSLHTVDEADRRGRDVMAVPGSVRNPASVGSNELLAEGRAPACSVDDVLVALGLSASRPKEPHDHRVVPEVGDRAVLDAVGWQPSSLDQLVIRTGLELARLAPALDRLCDAGWVARQGGWYERVAVTGPRA